MEEEKQQASVVAAMDLILLKIFTKEQMIFLAILFRSTYSHFGANYCYDSEHISLPARAREHSSDLTALLYILVFFFNLAIIKVLDFLIVLLLPSKKRVPNLSVGSYGYFRLPNQFLRVFQILLHFILYFETETQHVEGMVGKVTSLRAPPRAQLSGSPSQNLANLDRKIYSNRLAK